MAAEIRNRREEYMAAVNRNINEIKIYMEE